MILYKLILNTQPRRRYSLTMLGRTSHSVLHRGLRNYTGRLYTKSSTRPLSQNTVSSANEAFLEAPESEPHLGIKYLSLNRPQSKNALSMRLLKVSDMQLLSSDVTHPLFFRLQEFQQCIDFAENDKEYDSRSNHFFVHLHC